jgi:aldose 1-epimerase
VLPRNFGHHPHSLHGVGWQTAWTVAARDAGSATLVHRHPGGAAWPWRYQATQHVALDPRGLTATLTLRNEDEETMPASLGFHPYFPADAAARLRFDAAETWTSDATQLPTHAAPGGLLDAWRHGAPAKRAELVDHCHAGWSGSASLLAGGRETRIAAAGAGFLHVHSPPGKDFVGIEPVSAMPDAVNRPEPLERTGLRLLAPGEMMTLTMRVESAPTV